MSSAETWREAMLRARTLRPDRIAAYIVEGADVGLRASRYDAQGGRTTRIPCDDHEHCDDGPEEHSHLVVSDPTGNAATRGRGRDSSSNDLRRLSQAVAEFVEASATVLDWVVGKRPDSWEDVLLVNAELLPGTVQAGLDVDHAHHLPGPIGRVDRSVRTVAGIASDYLPREATQDEQHWTAGLADEEVCAWHLSVHRRYRRPKVGAYRGERICGDCMQLVLLGESRPPEWLIEAEVDRMSKPRAWHAALGRWLDELGIDRSA